MTAEKKIAQKKMTLLQLAEQLRNVSEACRRRGVSRTQFYEYKRAFQEGGFQGLMDRPPIPKTFRQRDTCRREGEDTLPFYRPSLMGPDEGIRSPET